MIEALKTNLLDKISKHTHLRKVAAHEFAGPCPRCGGSDRFRVNDQKGWFCRHCTSEPGSGGHWGDYADFTAFAFGWTLKDTLRSMGIERRLKPDEIEALDRERRTAQAAERKAEADKQATVHRQLTDCPDWRNYAENVRPVDGPQILARHAWKERGLSDHWIDYYAVGYCPDRVFGGSNGPFHSDSLTIPYFRPVWKPDGQFDHWHCIGLQHRLLIKDPPGGKYRPHLAGAGKHLFYTDLMDTQVWNGDLLLVEGEIKAMVTWSNLWLEDTIIAPELQVVGVPGKGWKEEWLAEFQKARRVFICLDPDAQDSAKRLCKLIGDKAKNILLPAKIDDLFNMEVIDAGKLLRLMESDDG